MMFLKMHKPVRKHKRNILRLLVHTVQTACPVPVPFSDMLAEVCKFTRSFVKIYSESGVSGSMHVCAS